MKLNDSIDMKGRLTLKLHDASGNLVKEHAADNAIVMAGRDLVAKLFAGIATDPISHIAVGTGNTAVDPANDTALKAESARKLITTKNITTDVGKMRITVSAEFGADVIGALTEAAIFNSATANSGVMYNRVVFDTINKPAEFKLTLVWEILF
jgi:hypothetical protein